MGSAVRQREAELRAAQHLAQEKEAALSQEQQRSSQERAELQGRLAQKVGVPLAVLPAADATAQGSGAQLRPPGWLLGTAWSPF